MPLFVISFSLSTHTLTLLPKRFLIIPPPFFFAFFVLIPLETCSYNQKKKNIITSFPRGGHQHSKIMLFVLFVFFIRHFCWRRFDDFFFFYCVFSIYIYNILLSHKNEKLYFATICKYTIYNNIRSLFHPLFLFIIFLINFCS